MIVVMTVHIENYNENVSEPYKLINRTKAATRNRNRQSIIIIIIIIIINNEFKIYI